MRIFSILLLLLGFSAQARVVDVLVWDRPFDRSNPLWPKEIPQGSWGAEFRFLPSPLPSPNAPNYLHGLQVSWVVMKEAPHVRLHFAGDAFLPWQDPEKCRLTSDTEFESAARRLGYQTLPNCRAEAEEGIRRLSRFIREHGIRLVNMSHGVYYDNYILRNPYLLADRFKGVEMDIIQRFLYRNFLAVGDVVESLFRENPDVLFVLAAGNNGDEVDREWYLKWSEDPPKKYPIPTLYATFTSRYPNVISVASTYDGEKLAGGSNYGVPNVLFAKKVGVFEVPNAKGEWELFGGTSAAAAQTTRLLSEILSEDGLSIRPGDLKAAILKSIEPRPKMVGLTLSGGVLEDDRLKNQLAESEIRRLPIIHAEGQFEQFTIPPEMNPRNYGCHSLVAAPDGKIWMTISWANLIAAFNPATGTFERYPLPTPESEPDGITIDSNGDIWAGVHPKGGLVRLNTSTGVLTEFPHPDTLTFNIIAADDQGGIWGTSHQARKLSRFSVKAGTFQDFNAGTDWPLNIRAGLGGDIWAAGLKGFGKPWGPGALIHFDAKQGKIEHFVLPERDTPARAFWIAPADRFVVATSMADGFFILDRETRSIRQYFREDGKQLYNITRRAPDGRVVLANGSEALRSLDVIDPANPASITSYALPFQGGEPREGLTFDGKGGAWYCQSSSGILGRLQL